MWEMITWKPNKQKIHQGGGKLLKKYWPLSVGLHLMEPNFFYFFQITNSPLSSSSSRSRRSSRSPKTSWPAIESRSSSSARTPWRESNSSRKPKLLARFRKRPTTGTSTRSPSAAARPPRRRPRRESNPRGRESFSRTTARLSSEPRLIPTTAGLWSSFCRTTDLRPRPDVQRWCLFFAYCKNLFFDQRPVSWVACPVSCSRAERIRLKWKASAYSRPDCLVEPVFPVLTQTPFIIFLNENKKMSFIWIGVFYFRGRRGGQAVSARG